MNLFAQIRKVDEAKRLVFGRLAAEAVDKADEIMDYATSKPHFVKWSEEIARDTGGQSLGNLRAMHGKVAAGKFTAIDFNDAEKAIDVCAKVVDDNEWQKVLEGVYTGFSIGGSYVGDKKVEKADGRDVTRYTAKPTEGSLVDRPCIPSARFFEVQKGDGTLQKVDFQAQPEQAAADAAPAADAEDVTVNGTADEVAQLGKLMNEHGLTLADLITKAVPAFIQDKIDAKKDGEAEPDGDEEVGPDGKPTKKAKAAAAAAGEPDGDEPAEKLAKAATAASDESIEKVEAALADALAKVGARNSGADLGRIKKIHDMTVELGAACAPAADKAAPDGDLAKVDTGALEKMVADAVTAATGSLSKALDDAKAQIAKLSAQPAPARIALRAVAKTEDTPTAEPLRKAVEPQPIVDDLGDAHVAAGLIKSLHQTGGQPLRK